MMLFKEGELKKDGEKYFFLPGRVGQKDIDQSIPYLIMKFLKGMFNNFPLSHFPNLRKYQYTYYTEI